MNLFHHWLHPKAPASRCRPSGLAGGAADPPGTAPAAAAARSAQSGAARCAWQRVGGVEGLKEAEVNNEWVGACVVASIFFVNLRLACSVLFENC